VIASFASNFLFVKTRKTAGTTVELVLSGWCGADDILTPLIWEDELTRRGLGFSPHGFCIDQAEEAAILAAHRLADGAEAVRLYSTAARSGGLRFWNHMPASAIRSRLPDFWDRAFKFTVERHPYEKAVSLAYFLLRDVPEYTIDDVRRLLELIVPRGQYRNDPLYRIDGELAVDRVIDYGDLWPALGELALRFGRTLPDPLPRAKVGYRRFDEPAAMLLTADQKREIRGICAWEFAAFGYAP